VVVVHWGVFYLCFVSVFCVLEQCSRPVTSTFEVAAALAPLVRPVLLCTPCTKTPHFFLMKFGQRPFVIVSVRNNKSISVDGFLRHTMGSFHGHKFQIFMYGLTSSPFWRSVYMHLFEFNNNSNVDVQQNTEK
jgi:hypothetical protein